MALLPAVLVGNLLRWKDNVTIDPEEYPFPPIEPLLGILKWMASREAKLVDFDR